MRGLISLRTLLMLASLRWLQMVEGTTGPRLQGQYLYIQSYQLKTPINTGNLPRHSLAIQYKYTHNEAKERSLVGDFFHMSLSCYACSSRVPFYIPIQSSSRFVRRNIDVITT
jgi:hypothetical protein